MTHLWEDNIKSFLRLASQQNIKLIMVGGGAVNFHGYQRHSADVDFWISTTDENLEKLKTVFKAMGYELEAFPDTVKKGEQNISVKFSPNDLTLELITRFAISKSFDEAYQAAELVTLDETPVLRWRVLSYNDLIESKKRAARPKDILDIQQLQKLNTKH